ADRNQTHSSKLGNLLRQRGVGKIFHLGKRERVRCEREGEDGGVSWIDLAIDGGVRELSGQINAACVYCGLHLLFGNVDVLVEVELQRDDRAPEGTRRGHLAEAWNLAELAFERSSHRRCHYFGIGSGLKRHHLNRRILDLGQGTDRELPVRDNADKKQADH